MDPRKNIEAQLAAAKSLAEIKRKAGESDNFEMSEVARLTGELERLNKIDEEARPAIEAMDQPACNRAATSRRASGCATPGPTKSRLYCPSAGTFCFISCLASSGSFSLTAGGKSSYFCAGPPTFPPSFGSSFFGSTFFGSSPFTPFFDSTGCCITVTSLVTSLVTSFCGSTVSHATVKAKKANVVANRNATLSGIIRLSLLGFVR
jgi:hypothetical protein